MSNLNNMKILILADVFFPDTIGGAGRVVYHLALELARKDHEIHVITRNDDGKWPSHEELAQNLFVHRFFSPSKESLGLFFKETKNSRHLANELMREIEFDLICTHQSLVAMGPLLLRELKRTPLIHYFHSPWHEEFAVKKQQDTGKYRKRNKAIALFMKKMEKRILHKASKVVVLSEYMREKVVKTHNYPEDRVVKIPGGVDLERYHMPLAGKAAAKKVAKLPTNKTVFLTVRNLVPRMGLENLIESFSQSKVLRVLSLKLKASISKTLSVSWVISLKKIFHKFIKLPTFLYCPPGNLKVSGWSFWRPWRVERLFWVRLLGGYLK
jgi:glycosyltransferase involved in cell wall biosynthesis